MKNLKLSNFGCAFMIAVFLCLDSGASIAANKAPLTPELAAKRENFRNQDQQRITNTQRQSAAEELKAKRLKVYKAKQAAKQSTPPNTTDIK